MEYIHSCIYIIYFRSLSREGGLTPPASRRKTGHCVAEMRPGDIGATG